MHVFIDNKEKEEGEIFEEESSSYETLIKVNN